MISIYYVEFLAPLPAWCRDGRNVIASHRMELEVHLNVIVQFWRSMESHDGVVYITGSSPMNLAAAGVARSRPDGAA